MNEVFSMSSLTTIPSAHREELSHDADPGAHVHLPTSAERWAEESPAYHAAVEYQPAAEDDFWRANHPSQPYACETSYESFAPAYRVGYEGYARHGIEGRPFREAEPLLRRLYEQSGGELEWDDAARPAAEAAWDRLSQRRIGTATHLQPQQSNEENSRC